jgi:phage terminase large subunit-like protein
MNFIQEYWNEIQKGNIVVGKRIIQQYKRLIDELNHPKDPWVFDEGLATRPITFIETFCKQSKGEWLGKEIQLQLFQKAKLQAIYGFVHKDTKFRRCRESLTIEGRKNGKSTEISGVGSYMLVGDGEGGPQISCVATKKDQARIVFNEAKNMVSQSPILSKYIKKRKSDLYCAINFGTFEPLASDSNTLDGLNLHCGIIDELHAIKDRNIYDVSKQSMSARRQPLMFMMTTAGFVRECIYDSLYKYACDVLDGVIEDDRFLAFIYELDDRSEWTDFKCWEKANPGLGTIKDYNELAANVERAKNDPDFLPTVLTKDFNIRDTVAGTWMTFDAINNEESFDMEEIRGCYSIGGTDLSSTTDLSCATQIIMKSGSEKKYVLQQYFLPEDLLEQRIKEDKIPYDKWAEKGLLTLCKGNKVDYSDVTEWFVKMFQEYDVRPLWIGYDPWNSQYWIQEMIDKGFEMIVVRQGAQTLSQPMKEMGADLIAKGINYNNNPVLKWCLTNTSVKRDDNDNIRPIKGQNQRQRIDGAVSLLIAYTILFQNMSDYKALI